MNETRASVVAANSFADGGPAGAAVRINSDPQETEFRLNGRAVSAYAGETIIEAAGRHGIEIPHLCYKPGMRPDGNCRACMVEIKGERVLAPSCCRAPSHGMEVSSDSPRAVHSQKLIVEMLAADVPARVYKPDSELSTGSGGFASASRASSRERSRRPTCRTRRWQSISTPAFSTRGARLPRGAGQRRDRLRASGRALADCVRSRRPNG